MIYLFLSINFRLIPEKYFGVSEKASVISSENFSNVFFLMNIALPLIENESVHVVNLL